MQGKHDKNARRHVTWPEIAQHEFLTHEGSHCVYGMNAVYQDGHHGNAVVSRHPIPVWENIDVSHHPLESRGLLHCEIEIAGWKEPLHCINVHLGLWARSRRFQLMALRAHPRGGARRRARSSSPATSTTGRGRRASTSRTSSASTKCSSSTRARLARSFPAQMPFFTLDRIYVRDLNVEGVERHVGAPWSRLSDHVALAARAVAPRSDPGHAASRRPGVRLATSRLLKGSRH